MINTFLKNIYIGSDTDDFIRDFIIYLEHILLTNNFDAMSDHSLFLQGGKKAIEEIIHEMKKLQQEYTK